ncbi:nitrate- and nitrite sensing domain-containing protein [Streptomyces albireticuli]|uniref:histidine kinase n=1 Tax=Streptomyces albireticuli TaxID=1940 RepID=A0A2A2D467_9ACTN|nr:nitrate- and nitrite sensing domain-containing protein [Streptomyces albireticuli]MCD9144134.1 nitrate- and nitrite sensing domain-containing protein [Streptomyces albireticuli]MCD9162223.1 nitrate- and nitrite sensing domain-containing protein [Streptomyces albireticuli]MCD9195608.1 nitrate- and nitrite sensing domain-containing protein [Streptomyces albireticuli]PAU47233.1 ATPase [Streptomyces albireticuli]
MTRRKTGAAQQARDERGNFTPPSRTAVPPPADVPETPAPPAGRGGRFSPRNWRVPVRLNAILMIPVLVALVFGGLDVKSSVDTWTEAKDAANTARLVRSAATYAHAVIDERDLIAEPMLKGQRDTPAIKKAQEATDAAREEFDKAVQQAPDTLSLRRRIKLFREAEQTLPKLRKIAYTPQLDGVKTEDGYGAIQRPLMAFANELGLGTGSNSYGRMVYAIELAKAAESLQRSIGTHLLVKPGASASKTNPAGAAGSAGSAEAATGSEHEVQVTAFSSYNFLEYIARGEYDAAGGEDDISRLNDIMATKAKISEQDKMFAAISSGKTPKQLAEAGVTPDAWFTAATAKFDAYREVEKELADKAVDEAELVSSNAQRDAILHSSIMIVALLIAFFVAGMMARSMSRNMRHLRRAAFDVAEQRLPALVDQLSRTDPGRVDTRIQPIPITTRDEIGEVARAFDQVHREAVRLAAEQALLRGNVNAIFTNLSRRNQSLIEGQLTLITELEEHEADPDQLENLFRLDHLATRMRRNGENLLVLAGEEPGRRWDQPVPLVDVLRAASSEVEAYERIELSGVPDAEIHGLAVTDLVHLLAELLENATTFSSPHTKVRVTATRLPDGRVMVEIHDKGIGLTAEDFADINHRLANPPSVDVAIAQRMGLFVVGRLATRHGIRVQLRPSGEQAGTTSLVMLPDAITHGGGGEDELSGDDFTVSRMVPEQQSAPAARPRTAAELGFDDSRYEPGQEAPSGAPSLDPVGRSRLREERRAALEAQQQAAENRPLFRDEVPQPQQAQPYDQQSFDQQSFGRQYEQPQQAQPYEQRPDQDTGQHAQHTGQHAVPQHDQQGYEQSYDQSHQQHAYPDAGYPEQGYAEAGYPEAQAPFGGPGASAQQAGWQDSGAYQDAGRQAYGADSESLPPADTAQPERVEFDRPGPASSGSHSLTGAGLPRRAKQWQEPESVEEATGAGVPEPQQDVPQQPQEGEESDWRSTNDERWHRAEQLREPKAGGITSSGLPRRVPKANLVEGKAAQTPQDGPQISRAPEDVRGRLSNLRRGVQQGRSAGNDTTAHEQHEQHGQGFGPGGTYDQER